MIRGTSSTLLLSRAFLFVNQLVELQCWGTTSDTGLVSCISVVSFQLYLACRCWLWAHPNPACRHCCGLPRKLWKETPPGFCWLCRSASRCWRLWQRWWRRLCAPVPCTLNHSQWWAHVLQQKLKCGRTEIPSFAISFLCDCQEVT